MTVTGFMLAFLANAAFIQTRSPHWTNIYLLAALVVFSLGLLAGVVALFPRISIRGYSQAEDKTSPAHLYGLFIDAHWFQMQATDLSNKELYETLCASIHNKPHATALAFRRKLLRVQLVAIVVAIFLLLVASGGKLAG